MVELTATELAKCLKLSKGRISQLAGSGQLDGCFHGEGRARRFDLVKVAKALGQNLDPGQMMGNGAPTRAALKNIEAGEPGSGADAEGNAKSPAGASTLSRKDPDRYELARIQKAEEEARKLRRGNEEAEGSYVLASQVASEVSRQISREIAGFESTVIRDGARRVADELGVDFKTVRAIMTEIWRDHRKRQSGEKFEEAQAATMSSDERDADI